MGLRTKPTRSAALLSYGAAGHGVRGGVSRKPVSAQATAVAPEKRQTERDRERVRGGGSNKGSGGQRGREVKVTSSSRVKSSGITSADCQGMLSRLFVFPLHPNWS